MKVAFLGLGVMGFPMAGHLKAKGFDVTVYNRTEAKAKAWAEQYGGAYRATPAEAAAGADFVMMCVGNDKDLMEVALEALKGLKKGAVLVDHTTASAEAARKLYTLAKAQGVPLSMRQSRVDRWAPKKVSSPSCAVAIRRRLIWPSQ